MSLRIAFLNTSDRRPTPAKKTPPVLVSSTLESRQESTSMSDQPTNHQPRTVHVVSFGYLHGEPPSADLVVDVRRLLHDPARFQNGGLLDLDGRHPVVRDTVMTTPGALQLANSVYSATFHLYVVVGKPVTIAFGCAGGRHRSVALAEHLAGLLINDPISDAIPVRLDHLHIHLPRVLRDGDDNREVQ